MRVRLLGSVDVTVDGVARPVTGLRRKAALAALALHPGEVVTVDLLVDTIWSERPPATAANTLQSVMSYLRRVFGSPRAIVARPPGYLLDLAPDGTDVLVAEGLIAEAARGSDPAVSASRLRAALALWRGPVLAGVADLPRLREHAHRLDRVRSEAERALVEARLALGEHGELVPELEHLVARNPFDEQLCGQLMLALHRTGRQSEALAVYRRMVRTLADDLGIEPGTALRNVHTAVLRQDPALDPPTATTSARPAQLPLAVSGFTGRESELDRLDGLPANGRVGVLSGTAGVGKTALAVHWAHRVAPRFPDGQLYLDLRGFSPSDEAVEPGVALRWFLDALGVPARAVPTDLAARAALYRSTLDGRRVLVVLDNARDAAQVRPLLPGSPTTLVLVTSRDRLLPLVVGEGAVSIALDLPSPADARRLLVRRAGPGWRDVDPDAASSAVDEIVARCARLPLALTLAAAQVLTHPGDAAGGPDWLAGQLLAADTRLDALDGGDPVTDVRAVLSWSYTALTGPAARLFRLLGKHAGPDVSRAAVASMVGAAPRVVDGLLRELTRANLLTENRPGRFACHDLLRLYAFELAMGIDGATEARAAVRRVVDHYLHTAHAATLLLNPSWAPLPLDGPAPGAAPVVLADTEQALAWCSAEIAVLVGNVRQAVNAGLDDHAWRLAWTLTDYLERQGEWDRWISAHEAGLDAARRLGDGLAQAHLHRGLGRAWMWQGRFPDATGHFRRSLRLFEDEDDHAGQARVWHNLCQMYDMQGDRRRALEHGREALRLSRQIGNRAEIAKELNTVGWCRAEVGELGEALRHCEEALALWREVHDTAQEASTWDTTGYIHHRLADFGRAVECFERSLPLMRRIGDRVHEAGTLIHCGDSLLALGERERARQAWQEAEHILADLDHPERAEVLIRLDDLAT